jgi:predicted DNA-binding transcriptional regulator YafY
MKMVDVLERMEDSIHQASTGTPEEFARRMGISTRTLYNYLHFLRDKGAPIQYSRIRETYYYEYPGKLRIKFEPE